MWKSIDRIDSDLVRLICEREGYIRQAAGFKKDAGTVKTPGRVEQVIRKVRKLAEAHNGSANLVQQVYHKMTAEFIATQMRTFEEMQPR